MIRGSETTMSQQTILIADDQSNHLNVVSLKLQEAGYRVLTASDGRQALHSALRNRPHLLIANYHMPHLSAVELSVRLRQASAAIPAIILTERGYTLEPRAIRPGSGIRTVTRPITPRQLLCTVDEVLRQAA
jgi:DNA-binding response OmpR family regulator